MLTDFRERGREGERERTSMQYGSIKRFPFIHALTRDQAQNLGMCPDWESNPQPFGVWDDAPNS